MTARHEPPRVYVAGAFTAPTTEGVRENIRRASARGHEARKLGAYVLVPHLLGAPYIEAASVAWHVDDFGYQWWITETLAWMRTCNALLTVDGWEHSSGSRGEVKSMTELGRPVFHDLLNLKDWLMARAVEGAKP